MKRYYVLFLVSVISFCASAQNEIVVDANAEIRTVKSTYNAIRVWGGIDLYLSQSDEEAIAVSASEERFREEIKTVIENGTLKIFYTGMNILNRKDRKLKVYVSFKKIDKLEISGASDVVVAGSITGKALNLHLSGSSDFKGDVQLEDLQLDLSGASDIRITGKVTTVQISSSGASDVKGDGLTADICTAKMSGASDINIKVNKELNVNASGASKITYKGDALIKDMHTSGASKIARQG